MVVLFCKGCLKLKPPFEAGAGCRLGGDAPELAQMVPRSPHDDPNRAAQDRPKMTSRELQFTKIILRESVVGWKLDNGGLLGQAFQTDHGPFGHLEGVGGGLEAR